MKHSRTARMTWLACALLAGAAIGSVTLVAAAPSSTSSAQNVPNAVQGFSQNRGQPVNIESLTLEVRDKKKMATFLGNVHLTQGDTVLQCKTLVVFYEEDSKSGTGMRTAAPTTAGSSQQQQIKRLEAKGDVIVTQKDQTATGENGLFDLKTNTVTLSGNVVITQGQNVVKGDRLIVDLTTSNSRMEGNVRALILPNSRDAKPQDAASTTPPAPAPVQTPSRPMRLN